MEIYFLDFIEDMDIEISVVIPVYNSGDEAVRAIESVINQTRFDAIKEIIVVDDGSVDSSFEKISSLKEEKIKLVKQENKGAAGARNTGIKMAQAEYIALLDSDDTWVKEKIQNQIEILKQNKQIDAIGSAIDVYQLDTGEKITEKVRKISVKQYLRRNYPQTSTILFKKDLLENVGFFITGMRYAEEGVFFLRLAAINQLYYTIEPLVNYGNGKPSFGHSGLSGNLRKMHEGIFELHKFALKNKYINCTSYFIFNVYEELKYIRRCGISFVRKICKK